MKIILPIFALLLLQGCFLRALRSSSSTTVYIPITKDHLYIEKIRSGGLSAAVTRKISIEIYETSEDHFKVISIHSWDRQMNHTDGTVIIDGSHVTVDIDFDNLDMKANELKHFINVKNTKYKAAYPRWAENKNASN